MKASDVLRAAKERIVVGGWMQNGYSSPHDERVCAALAISRPEGFPYLQRAVGLPVTQSHQGIWDWNDAPERTLTDVLDAFDHSIKLALEDEALNAEFDHAPSLTYEDTSLRVDV